MIIVRKRCEVRRDIAQGLLALLKDHRRENSVPDDCPLRRALNQKEKS